MAKKVALVVGATGLAGNALVRELSEQPDWQVIALSRRPRSDPRWGEGVVSVACDCADPARLEECLRPFSVTHVFYLAHYTGRHSKSWFPHTDWGLQMESMLSHFAGQLRPLANAVLLDPFYGAISARARLAFVDENLAMLQGVLDVLERSPHRLRNVLLMTGGRYYGHHLGPYLSARFRLPFRENGPRQPGPNWYYAVEDELQRRRAAGADWAWTVLRPSVIIGFADSAPFNFGTGLALYASLLREAGRPLLFPGSPAMYEALVDTSSASMLAHAMLWAAGEPRCRDEAFNITTGDCARWDEIWAAVAAYFDMPVEAPRQRTSAAAYLGDDAGHWETMIEKYGLRPYALKQLLSLEDFDEMFGIDWNLVYSNGKARAAGFAECESFRDPFVRLFDDLRALRVIP